MARIRLIACAALVTLCLPGSPVAGDDVRYLELEVARGIVGGLAELNGGGPEIHADPRGQVECALGRIAEGVAPDVAEAEQERLHLQDGLVSVCGDVLKAAVHGRNCSVL